MIRVLSVFGTRPEAIKMAPVIRELEKYPGQVKSLVCTTAQHREMLDQVLDVFDIRPDVDLDLMQLDQGLPDLTAQVLTGLSQVLEDVCPDVVLVQGDTTTVMAGALAAFYRRIPVGHVEAGLRSGNRYAPFPEEINRRIAGVLSTLHFAPTQTARRALLCEGVPDSSIHVTGNTVIDALQWVVRTPVSPTARAILSRIGLNGTPPDVPRLVLVTAHRRENLGRFENICCALRSLAERNPDLAILYPVHLNPNVQEPVYRLLSDVEQVYLTGPVEYDTFVHLMNASTLVLTDSGGLQEEAPALGKPVLVMRTETERPEAVEAGVARLIGTDTSQIVQETERLLHDPAVYEQMSRAVSPYGDGHAAERIVDVIRDADL